MWNNWTLFLGGENIFPLGKGKRDNLEAEKALVKVEEKYGALSATFLVHSKVLVYKPCMCVCLGMHACLLDDVLNLHIGMKPVSRDRI